MKKFLIIVFVLLNMFLGLKSQDSEGIDFFHGTWEEVLVKAKKDKKPIFVDAYAKWCGPCKYMAANVFTKEDVGKYYNKHFINYKFDMETPDGRAFQSKYMVKGYPSFLYFDDNGNLIHRDIGGRQAPEFINMGKTAINKLNSKNKNNKIQTDKKKEQIGIEFFHGTWEEVLVNAKKDKKPIFVDAYAKWCGPCKYMAANVFTKEDVGKYYNKHFINYKFDMETPDGRAFQSKYMVKGYPSFLYFDDNGNLIHRDIGGKQAPEFINMGKTAISKLPKENQKTNNTDDKVTTDTIKKMQAIFTQNIRGTVIDKDSEMPLVGASVVLMGTNPPVGSVTNVNGQYRIDSVAIGRIGLKFSFIGYKPVVMDNIILQAGKELIINVVLEEKVITTDEVVVKAKKHKSLTNNELATVSARSFTVEETNKYAGSLGDPSRMAMNFAGVMSAGDSRNDIIIRGNSPLGLLWRLDGIEIPNPNHFGALGTTGGPVSMLNNNLLTNSDFFSGAFPAEYGNALSGVFDLKMRSGNNTEREYVGQIGFNGFELGAEGPFSKNSRASYLVNYRYSTLAVFNMLGFDAGTGSSVPQYQDLSFKIDVPDTKYGRFTLFGIGGISYIEFLSEEKDSTEFSYGLVGTDTRFGANMGVVGLSHTIFINSKSYIKSYISAQGAGSYTKIDSVCLENDSTYPFLRSNLKEYRYTISTNYKLKINKQNNLSAGISVNRFNVDYSDSVWVFDDFAFRTLTESKGSLHLIKSYTQWQHKFSNVFTTYTGLYSQYFDLNSDISIEPRLGLKWETKPNQALNAGIGLHSQTQPKMIYFLKSRLPNGDYIETNRDVKYTYSLHTVLGYDYFITSNLHVKAETYYQHLFNIPVQDSFPQFSMLNAGDFFAIPNVDSLENKGTGYNYGFELTLEKFFSNNFYFLSTLSLFNSKYVGADGILRNTSFNGNHVFNILGGYEFEIGNNKQNRFGIDVKLVSAGGRPYVPINIEESITENTTVNDYSKAYEQKYQDYFRFDVRISFKLNKKRTNQEWAIDLQNITNHQNVFAKSYDPLTKSIHTDYQQGFYPMFLYRILF